MTATGSHADLVVGTTAGPRHFGPITRTDIVRYQGASGDFHPLHHDEPYAQSCGYPTVFSVGMLQAGLLGTFVSEWLGVDHLRSLKVRFRDQVWPEDELSCTGTIVVVDPRQDATVVEVELACVRQTGASAMTGTARFEFPAT